MQKAAEFTEERGDMTRIRVRMLGKLEISCEGREISLKCTRDSRYMQLFLLLLYHNKKGISRQEIIEELYAGKESSPDNALRIVVYRLRKLLSQTFLPKEKFVVSDRKGQYRLGENITVTLDTDDFLSMYEKINGASDEADRIRRLSQTCDLYEGHFLKDFHGETWIEIENSYFQRLYLKASKELAALLEKRRQYRELRELTDKNIRLFPYDGWQFLRIRSLAQEGKKKEAAIIYEETLRAFQEEFGVGLPQDIIDKFEEAERSVYDARTPGGLIKSVIRRDEEENGAYYCGYLGFLDCCRVMRRVSERNGEVLTMLTVTFKREKGNEEKADGENQEIDQVLREAIHGALRKGDVYTRYGTDTYLILMCGIQGERECFRVFCRIEERFNKIKHIRNTKLQYRVYPINWN